jgi:antitoxin (DNA-binding transcriptional repressor) of toxin-antitoxin stability system
VARLSATEAARRFSEVLNRVADGEEIEITRAGAPVAVMARPRIRLLSAERFRELLASAPPVDEDFAGDLRRIRREAGVVPEPPWPS